MNKECVRLHATAIEQMPWEPVEGAPAGVYQKVLSQDPGSGSVTRLLRAEPWTEMGLFIHDHWEEVWILEGSAKLGSEFHPAGTYTCKCADIEHGPIITDTGFLNLEIRDYNREDVQKPSVRLYPIDIERLPWEQGPDSSSGVYFRSLARDNCTSCETVLLKANPNTEVPTDLDEGFEEIYILEGECEIDGELYPSHSYLSRMAGTLYRSFYTSAGMLAIRVRTAC